MQGAKLAQPTETDGCPVRVPNVAPACRVSLRFGVSVCSVGEVRQGGTMPGCWWVLLPNRSTNLRRRRRLSTSFLMLDVGIRPSGNVFSWLRVVFRGSSL
ncbi:hypothetical protein PAHAL_2G143100 [Panicum hallii]|uniref:Uncharacterized protein n=1 Tax=Panicum hallii TaxID=206008 RepID=A0A2T8KP82_9POAL|nr:hypothetical protein PAHAL_2G143100 [Panicum hallii]